MVKVLVRTAGLGAIIVASYGVSYLLRDRLVEDTGLGTGLIAFLLLAVVSMAWALVDTRVGHIRHSLIVWGATSLIVAVGWIVALSLIEAEEEGGFGALFARNLELVPFQAALIFIPAGFGALLGLSRPRTAPPE